MADLQDLFDEIDSLSSDDLEQVYRHIIQRREPIYWLLPGENLKAIQQIIGPAHEQTAHMSDDEVNTAIDVALREVRHERQ
jgi:hypothetical protein